MDWYAPIRNYCERTGDLLWSEPVNAITNLSFFIAALLLWKSYKAAGQKDRQFAALIALIAIVGFGSSLFHTFANGLTMLADVIPIALFTFFYLWVVLRRLIGLSQTYATACLLLFAGVASQMPKVSPEFRFNGSIDYLPCLAALLIISAILYKKSSPASGRILIAAICFIISLTFRSVDFAICPSFPLGTHFLWHTLNGFMLYMLASVFLLHQNPAK
jgi:ribose/xylose/arabinose/galactoside ABC-type transport system permease subunit